MAFRGGIHIDDSELQELDLDLGRAPIRIRLNATRALAYGAREIDREMTIDATGHKGNVFGRPGTDYVTDLEKHVSHELITPLVAEIGIENEGSGSLAHLFAYGGPYNDPVYDSGAGPRRAQQRVLREFADRTEDSVFGKGGR